MSFERLQKEEETRLGRPLTDLEKAEAMHARVRETGGRKKQKRAMRKAIRYGANP